MKTRRELLKSPYYWNTGIQIELYHQFEAYMKKNHLNRTELAKHLGCTKGYVSQLLSGDFDHKMSKFFELSLAIGKIPVVKFEDVDKYIQEDKRLNQNMLYSKTSAVKIEVSVNSVENNIPNYEELPVPFEPECSANINNGYSKYKKEYINAPQA